MLKEVDKIVFNEYGNPHIPTKLERAQIDYMNTLKPYLDELSIVEVRAVASYLGISTEIAFYIVCRQLDIHKAEAKTKLA